MGAVAGYMVWQITKMVQNISSFPLGDWATYAFIHNQDLCKVKLSSPFYLYSPESQIPMPTGCPLSWDPPFKSGTAPPLSSFDVEEKWKTPLWPSSHRTYMKRSLWHKCGIRGSRRTTERLDVSPSGICTLRTPVTMATWERIRCGGLRILQTET